MPPLISGLCTCLVLLAVKSERTGSPDSRYEAPSRGQKLMQMRAAPETQSQRFLHQLRVDLANSSNDTEEIQPLQPLHWKILRRFPPLMSRDNHHHPNCSKVGMTFPQLVSRERTTMEEFYNYTCGSATDFFVTDPTVALTATAGKLEQGCVNLQPWPEMLRVSNRTHGEYIYRSCGGENDNCSMDEFAHSVPITVDEDVLLVSSFRSLPKMEYQHSLLDFLAPAWLALNGFREELLNGSLKMLTITPWQDEMLQVLGLPEDSILQLDIGEFQPDQPKLLLCSKRTLHLFRPGGPTGERLPEMPFRDRRVYSDFWHRFFNWQVRHEITSQITRNVGLEEPLVRGEVVFLQRCTDRRPIANEQEAVSLTRSVLTAANRSELLSSVCGSREDFREQIREMRTARLVVGAHGGALANLLFAPADAGVLEFVGTAAAHKGLEGMWPPYKSYWYGGAGAAFNFFRVVLYDADATGAWYLRLPDYEEGLQQWIATTGPKSGSVDG